MSREPNIIFTSIKKINQLHIKDYFTAKNSFVTEQATFNYRVVGKGADERSLSKWNPGKIIEIS